MQAPQSNKWSAIVIGSGLGGLSAAASLAAAGKKVLLLESYSVLGGSSHVFRRKNTWEFDCGVHYVGDCGENGYVPTLLRGLGLGSKIEWLQMDRHGFDTIIGPDLSLQIPSDWDEYLANLIRAFPKEERGLRYYVSVLMKISNAFDHGSDLSSITTLAKTAIRARTAAPWMMVPHAVLLGTCGFSPKTMLALSLQDGALASNPMTMPVGMKAVFCKHYISGGSWYPRGGGQMLAAGFAEVITSHGGHIRTRAHVDKILLENGSVTGVRLSNGEELSAETVIAAGDIKKTYQDLIGPENLPGSMIRRVDKWKMAYPLINACFGIELDITKTPNSNFYVIPNWDHATSYMGLRKWSQRMFTDASKRAPMAWAKDFAKNQSAFVQCSTRRDPDHFRSAPPGHAAIEVQTLAPATPSLWGFDGFDVRKGGYKRNAQYQQVKEIVTEGLLQRLEQAYPGASAKVRWSELGTPASQERFTLTSGGSAFGLESSVFQFGPFRPGTRTQIKGLFLAGASTVWGPGTVGSMISGVHAASAIIGRDLMAEFRAGRVLGDPARLRTWDASFDPLAACRRFHAHDPLHMDDELDPGQAELDRTAA